MSITLAQFYADVSSELRRGTSLDTHIPRKVRQAVRWLENQHTFRHMERFATMIIDPDVTYPRTIALPSGFKKMNFWRIVKTGNVFHQLIEVDPKDISRTDITIPAAYWQDGMDYFWLDNTPDQIYNGEMSYTAFTELPSDTNQVPYVIQNFEGVLLHATCVAMSPLMRDSEFKALHGDLLQGEMQAVIDSDVENRQGNNPSSVEYGWEYREAALIQGSN